MHLRRLTIGAAASVLALGALASSASAAGAEPTACGPQGCTFPCPTGTCIWAGYGVYGPKGSDSYGSISGDFRLPAITGHQDGTVGIWYGLGGAWGDALEQIGAYAQIQNGGFAVYKAFWEVLYNGGGDNVTQAMQDPHVLEQTVAPGDWFQAEVSYSASPAATGGTYYLSLRDVTRDWKVTVPVSAGYQQRYCLDGKCLNRLVIDTNRDSAEAILEDRARSPLPDFGTVNNIGNIQVNGGYAWTQTATEYTLGTGKVYISPLAYSGDFTVTWEHS